MPTLTKGKNLNSAQIEQVKRSFVHRMTQENRRNVESMYKRQGWTLHETKCGANPWESDAEWIASHAFYILKNGALANRPNRCEPEFLAIR